MAEMNFEEKIDARRMTLGLAMHDNEAQHASIQALKAAIDSLRLVSASEAESIREPRIASAGQADDIRELTAGISELRIFSAGHPDSIHGLMGISQNLVLSVQGHDGKIAKLERRA